MPPDSETKVDYSIRSSVLGGRVVTELNEQGQKKQTAIYLGNEVIAEQVVDLNNAQLNKVVWEYRDASGATLRARNQNGQAIGDGIELDAVGGNAGTSDPYQVQTVSPRSWKTDFGMFSYGNSFATPCNVDGFMTDCGRAMQMINNGSAAFCPNNNCGPRVLTNGVREVLAPLTRDPNTGQLGYSYTYLAYNDRWETEDEKYQKKRGFRPAAPNPFDRAGIRTGLQAALDKPGCAPFVDALLSAASGGTSSFNSSNLLNLFDSLFNKGQFGLTRQRPKNSAGYGNAIRKGNKRGMYILGNYPDAASQLTNDIGVALHELMHLAGLKGNITDRDFADAFRDNPDYEWISRFVYPLTRKNLTEEDRKALESNDSDVNWSQYWGDALTQICFQGIQDPSTRTRR